MYSEKLLYAIMADEGDLENQAMILTRSIRSYAGKYHHHPIWILFPDEFSDIPEHILTEYEQLNVRLIPFSIKKSFLKFPFAAKSIAASIAEDLASDHFERMAWFDSTSILFNEPDPLIIPDHIVLGYRPVDHTLIGSSFYEALDDFWKNIYQVCNVSNESIFPMQTMADNQIIRPYFNAGFFVVNPRMNLLQNWSENFKNYYQLDIFQSFFKTDNRYEIFFHQAIFSGTILSSLLPEDFIEIPNTVNYPLHMHWEIPEERRIKNIKDLISGRYCMDYNPTWLSDIPLEEPLKSWLLHQFKLLQ